jgi:hypothetical protein
MWAGGLSKHSTIASKSRKSVVDFKITCQASNPALLFATVIASVLKASN